MLTVAKKNCVGCSACLATCPKDAISTAFDDEGFAYPQIDESKCVKCGLCEKACPALNPTNAEKTRLTEPDVFACWSNDEEDRAQSSSGGMFSVYAKKILERGGVVYGVAFDGETKAVVARCETVDELAKLRSSKYVQAEVGAAFRDVLADLRAGRPVLYTGTPCQVAGLYGFLGGKEYDRLYTCDLICHGAPSPILFRKWVERLEKKYGGKIVSLNLRGKRDGYIHLVVVVVDSRPNEPIVLPWSDPDADFVGRMFISNFCLRPSCANCPGARIPRVADITLGDFWGVGKTAPFHYDLSKGVSVNLINSEQGRRLVESCGDDATWDRRTLPEAIAGNPPLVRSAEPHYRRDAFLRDARTLDYDALVAKYRKYLYGSAIGTALSLAKKFVAKLFGDGFASKIKKILRG